MLEGPLEDAVTLGVTLGVRESELMNVDACDAVGGVDALCVREGPLEAPWLADCVADDVADAGCVVAWDCEGDNDRDALLLADEFVDGDADIEGEVELLADVDWLPDDDGDCVAAGVAVDVALASARLADEVAEDDGDWELLNEGVLVREAVPVIVGVAVAVGLPETVSVPVPEKLFVWVAERLRLAV